MRKINKKLIILILALIISGTSLIYVLEAQEEGCTDTDGYDVYTKGSCVDVCMPEPIYDSCGYSGSVYRLSTDVYERYCEFYEGGPGDPSYYYCDYRSIECSNGECCEDGVCDGVAGTCSDSDATSSYPNGRNIYQAGQCHDNCMESGAFKADSCYDSAEVAEYYCNSKKHCEVDYIDCPSDYHCEDGACVEGAPEPDPDPGPGPEPTQPDCEDDDPANDVHIGGDCIDIYGKSHYDACRACSLGSWRLAGSVCADQRECECSFIPWPLPGGFVCTGLCTDAGSDVQECPNGECCVEPGPAFIGRCNGVAGSCSDTDPEDNVMIKGSCDDSCISPQSDQCIDTHHVREWGCSARKHCGSYAKACPLGTCCADGKCSPDNCALSVGLIPEHSKLACTITTTTSPTPGEPQNIYICEGRVPINNVDLKAEVHGTLTGDITYQFACQEDSWGNPIWEPGIYTSSETTYIAEDLCDYSVTGIYTPRVGVTRAGVFVTHPAEINVVPVSLSVGLTANPDFGTAPLDVGLTATVGGNAVGQIGYEFRCDVSDSWSGPYSSFFTTSTFDCNYPSGGRYTAEVRVSREGLTAADSVKIKVNNRPQCSAGSDKIVEELSTTTFNDATASDPDGICSGSCQCSSATSTTCQCDDMSCNWRFTWFPWPPGWRCTGFFGCSCSQAYSEGCCTAHGCSWIKDEDNLTYSWSCGMGTLDDANSLHPVYTAPLVSSPTTYTCALTVEDPWGATKTCSLDVDITNISPPDNYEPTAVISCDPSDCSVFHNWGPPLELKSSNSTDPDNDITTSTWFLDGISKKVCPDPPWELNILCNYFPQAMAGGLGVGNYTAKLVVRDSVLNEDFAEEVIQIKRGPEADFMCSLTGTPGSWQVCENLDPKPLIGDKVYFHDFSTSSEDGIISQRTWILNEGTPDEVTLTPPLTNEITASTTDLIAGDNKVKLTIYDTGVGADISVEHTISATFPLPEYREVPPTTRQDNFLARLNNIFTRF